MCLSVSHIVQTFIHLVFGACNFLWLPSEKEPYTVAKENVIASPNYGPGNIYPSETFCLCKIVVPQGKVISHTYINFNMIQ